MRYSQPIQSAIHHLTKIKVLLTFKAVQHTAFTLLAIFLLASCNVLSSDEEEVVPPIITDPPSSNAFDTAAAFQNATVPARDLANLTTRFNNGDAIPETAEPTTYSQGDDATFWYKDHESNENIQVNAALVHQTENLNLWFQDGTDYDEETEIQEAATTLEDNILPTVRNFFGQEQTPGVDGDPRIQILHLDSIGGTVAGYYSQADEFVTAVNPFSNQKEMLYISLEYAPIGSDEYFGVIAHEYQHMIHSATDGNEASWLNEGLSELSAHLTGYGSDGFIQSYIERTDTQLNDFVHQSDATRAHYGGAFIFTTYFLERFGEEATRALVLNPANGPESIEATLADIGSQLTFDDLFADWLAANYLDGRANTGSIYNYEQLQIPALKLAAEINRFPTTGEAAVHQYGADYLEIESQEPVTLIFTGTTQTSLIDATAHSGAMFWSSYPADNSDVTLTREFDLTGLDSATLTFWTWYELESGWDYAYLTISEDGGQSWHLLETTQTTLDNPQGNSYGPAFTGNSGGGEEPIWTQDTADLTNFTGAPILVRFEVVTDEAVHFQGFALDDIALTELEFLDDAENDGAGWEAAGFVRHANILPQSFLLQLILLGENNFEVQRLALEDGWHGRFTIPFSPDLERAVIIVSGNTPVTRQPAGYTYNFIKETP
jgi:immune inhibitor A